MPINKFMMKSMKEKYWEKWEKIYYAVEMKHKKKGIKKRGSPHDRMVEKAAWITHKKGIPKKK